MDNKLNAKQQAVLDFIKQEIKRKGYPPSVREIGKAVGFSSSSTVHNYLNQLEKLGYIRRDPALPRAIVVNEPDNDYYFEKDMVEVPLLGKVTAGLPILAVENIEERFRFPRGLLPVGGNIFMLRVIGDSMINAGIYPNDYVFVKQQPFAHNGEIVVALIDEEATIKRFFIEGEKIVLRPENEKYKPIILDEVSILGKVIGLYRKM
ncbi:MULTISPECIES: transcriptional repressor LexA [Carboxydocella]|uniref:LexA repressor n=2 Tax=Carboxydocella TaxID=178898 RepID=A0A1T4LW18_9FIRM|nr:MULTISPECIES: transcriptional repressor LexA [Carboxydocella]AVX20645.1 repressor LexA [Carboxydocella thermautotrophica]GAW32503.1 repressor LexA [Carboxydocella sp. JDF658]SJZ58939.1 repressor LexA [Carboxydocella sporoproducens DSM 16521]